jgi:hypothetical protein
MILVSKIIPTKDNIPEQIVVNKINPIAVVLPKTIQ